MAARCTSMAKPALHKQGGDKQVPLSPRETQEEAPVDLRKNGAPWLSGGHHSNLSKAHAEVFSSGSKVKHTLPEYLKTF